MHWLMVKKLTKNSANADNSNHTDSDNLFSGQFYTESTSSHSNRSMPLAMSNGYNHLYTTADHHHHHHHCLKMVNDHTNERDALLPPSPVAAHRHSSGPITSVITNGESGENSGQTSEENNHHQHAPHQSASTNQATNHHESSLHINDVSLLYNGHLNGHQSRHITTHQHTPPPPPPPPPIGTQTTWNQVHSMAAVMAAHGNNSNNNNVANTGNGNNTYNSGNLFASIDSPPSTLVLATIKKSKRQPQPIPDNCKDDAYWERRKRNNESAKKSREMRRWKEQQTTFRVRVLEQENLKLKTEVTMLRNELENFRKIICNERRENIVDADSSEHKLVT